MQIILFENQFVSVFLQEPTMGTILPAVSAHHTHSLERNVNMKRVSSSSSIVNMSGSLSSFPSTIIGFGSTYMKLWQGLICLSRDPHPDVAMLAQKEIDYIVNQAVDLISAKEATKENFGSSLSLPPSPNTRTNYLGESPPAHINHNSNIQSNSTAGSTISVTGTVSTTTIGTSLLSKQDDGTGGKNSFPSNGNGSFSKRKGAVTPTIPQVRSRKNSRNMALLDAGATSATSDPNEQQPHQGDNGSAPLEQQKQQKPIVTTNFIPWCVSHFSSPSNLFKESLDRHEPEYLEKISRFQRNEKIRSVAKGILL